MIERREVTNVLVGGEKLDTDERCDILAHILTESPAVAFLCRASSNLPVDFITENISVFDYSPEDFRDKQRSLFEIVHPKDVDRVRSEIKSHTDSKRDRFALTFRVLTKTSQERWADCHMWIHRPGKQQPPHYHGIMLDITDRKLLEDVLDEEKYFINNVFNNSLDGIAVARRDGRFIALNPAIQRLFGYATAEIRTITELQALIFPDQTRRAEIQEQWQNDLAAEHPPPREYEAVAADGEKKWFRFRLSPMGGDNMLLTCQNVTQSKQIENELREARDELEARVQRRTTQLAEANARLQKEVQERKQYEKALEEKQLHFDNLVADVPGAVYRCLYDENWTMTYLSAGIEAMTGYPADDFINNARRTYASVIHPDDLDIVTQKVQAAVETNGSFLLHYRLVRSNGDTVQVVEKGRPCVADGHTVWIDGVIIDESEHASVKKRLEETRNNFQAMAENAQDAILIAGGPDGRHFYANPRACEITGYSADELLGMKIGDLVHPSEKGRLTSLYEARVAGKPMPRIYETLLQGRGGVPVPVEVTGARTTWEGQPATIGMLRDITERKRTEAQLQESKETAQELLNANDDIALLLDDQLVVLSVNKVAAQAVGAAMEQIVGRNVEEFAERLPLAKKRMNLLEQVLDSGKPARFQERLGDRVFQVTIYPALLDSRDSAKIAVFARDMTEHRRLQKDILNSATIERERIGRDLHDNLGQHLTGLSFVAKSLESRISRDDNPETADIAGQVSAMTREAMLLVKTTVRGLYPIECPQHRIAEALDELAAQAKQLYSIQCHAEAQKNITLTDDFVAVNLYYIAQEAIHNAAKHSGATEIWLELKKSNDTVTLAVTDNGTGIQQQTTGEGLGIRCMQSRADVIGAEFRIETAPGKGTIVCCSLPASD